MLRLRRDIGVKREGNRVKVCGGCEGGNEGFDNGAWAGSGTDRNLGRVSES